MADGTVGLLLVSAVFVVCARSSGVAVTDTTVPSRNMCQHSVGLLPALKTAFRDARRSGKIRDTTTHLQATNAHNMAGVNTGTSGRSPSDFDLFRANDWSRFMKTCNDDEWAEFETKERMFRQSIATAPMNVQRSYHHPSPDKWLTLLDHLYRIFYRDCTFRSTKPNGIPYSLPFLKYTVRILNHFPIELPECVQDCAEDEVEKLLFTIELCLNHLNSNLRTYFSRLRRRDPDRLSNTQDCPIISKGELTHVWQKRQRYAINIIRNDSRKLPSGGCRIDKASVYQHFQSRCQRTLEAPSPPPWNDDLKIPPPEWTPPDVEFSVGEVSDVIKALPSHRSPGHDGVTYDYLKQHRQTLAPVVTAIMNICANNRRVPREWKHSIITLAQKKNGQPNEIEDWRPISLLCTSYKIYMKLLQKRLVPWIVETGRMSTRQKGSMPRNGLQEHVFTLKTGIIDFLHQSSKLYTAFIDIKDAFGSIDHELMIRELEKIGYPRQVVEITRDIYTGSTFQVKTANGLTEKVTRSKGIIQGCPWSVIIFEQGIDKWLRWIERDYTLPHIPNPVQGYVDDVVIVSRQEEKIQEAARKTEDFMKYAGMQVKHRKCALMHGCRSGNNWSKKNDTSPTVLTIQGAAIPELDRSQTYRYLGYDVDLSASSEKRQLEEIISDFKETLEKIDRSPLPIGAKLQAANIMAVSRLHFHFPNIIFTEKALDSLEDALVYNIRSWLGLNDSSTRSFMFVPRSKGGLGVLNPRIMYHAKKLSFFLDVLNNSDEQTKMTARESLQLHLSKRKCKREDDPGENNFAGYKTDTNYRLIKESRVNWRQSHWIHLNELCARLKVRLQIEEDDNYVLCAEADEDIEVRLTDAASAFTFLKSHLISLQVENWQAKESQGRIARAAGIDYSLSSCHLTNLKLSDKLTKFVMKARLQLVECNTLLHTYYPTIHSKVCSRCGFASETISHILNGCKESKDAVQKRHDRVAEIVRRAVVDANPRAVLLANQIITKAQFTNSDQPFDNVRHTRPDLCVIDRERGACTIVEVSVPYDAFVEECYQGKFDKYLPLCEQIQNTGFNCMICVLIVGALGSVHRRMISGLQMTGIAKPRAKSIARYMSVSAMIGSSIIWRQRCRSVLPG